MITRTRRFSRDEYYRMAELGIFGSDERVELIEGEILPLSPQNKPHAGSVTRATRTLVRRFSETHDVRVQLPLDLGEHSQPEPDFALVPLGATEAATLHPTSADLVLEVAHSSLSYDRREKSSLYARYGIPELWVLDVQARRLFVYRQPGEDSDAPFGWSYQRQETLSEEEQVKPLRLEGAVTVRELL
ncbi:MAG: hypothetical protein AMXMBFR33_10800 [Candidatus Xenobia bacterium]